MRSTAHSALAHVQAAYTSVVRVGPSLSDTVGSEFSLPQSAARRQTIPPRHHLEALDHRSQPWRTTTAPLPSEPASSSGTPCWAASRWSCESRLFPGSPRPAVVPPPRFAASSTARHPPPASPSRATIAYASRWLENRSRSGELPSVRPRPQRARLLSPRANAAARGGGKVEGQEPITRRGDGWGRAVGRGHSISVQIGREMARRLLTP